MWFKTADLHIKYKVQMEVIVSILTNRHTAYSSIQHRGSGKQLPEIYNCINLLLV